MQEYFFGSVKGVEVTFRNRFLAIHPQYSQNLLDGTMFPKQRPCSLQANSGYAGKIITATKDGHSTKLGIRPSGERNPPFRCRHRAEIRSVYIGDRARSEIEFEQDVAASKH